MGAGTYTIPSDANDGQYYNGSWATTGNVVIGSAYTFLRWTNVTIPRGAIVTAAKITLTAAVTGDTQPQCYIYLCSDVNPSAPTSWASFLGQNLSVDYVTWDTSQTWTDGTTYDSPSLVDLIQAHVNQLTWESGNALMVLMLPGSIDNQEFDAVDAVLDLTWDDPPADVRVSQNVLEALSWEEYQVPNRVSQNVLEVISGSEPGILTRISQNVLEVISSGVDQDGSDHGITQLCLEVISSTYASESEIPDGSDSAVSQCVIEVISGSIPLPERIYDTLTILPDIDYDITKWPTSISETGCEAGSETSFNERYEEIDAYFEGLDARIEVMENVNVHGNNTFNGETGVTINLPSELEYVPYTVFITPTADPVDVGDVWVGMGPTAFTIYCSGTGTTAFRYTVAAWLQTVRQSLVDALVPSVDVESYEITKFSTDPCLVATQDIFNLRYSEIDQFFVSIDDRAEFLEDGVTHGNNNFASTTGVEIGLPSHLHNEPYTVFITPTADPVDVDEIWVDPGDSAFTVFNSGSGTTAFRYTIMGFKEYISTE